MLTLTTRLFLSFLTWLIKTTPMELWMDETTLGTALPSAFPHVDR